MTTAARVAADWPLLRQGFRLFFLGAGLWAIVAMALWLGWLVGWIGLVGPFDPVAWHAHEMLFGYAAAALAGFALTAIPNWTGRPPVRGAVLGTLALLWLLGRLALLAPVPPGLAAPVDLAFLVALATVALREIVAGRNWRNLPVVAALAVLAVANALTHAEALGLADSGALGRRLGAAALLALIALVGGRIVPSFTGNWLRKQDATRLPAGFGWIDRIAMATVVLALAAWTAAPEAPATAVLAAFAAAAMALRLARWRGFATLAEPLLWSLHLGYAWLAAGLALIAAGIALGTAPGAGWHALFTGAIGTMTLAVMTRATLGHGGRPLHADGATAAAYLLVSLAALLRLAAAFSTGDPRLWLAGAATAWLAAFALFTLRYAPLLLRRD